MRREYGTVQYNYTVPYNRQRQPYRSTYRYRYIKYFRYIYTSVVIIR